MVKNSREWGGGHAHLGVGVGHELDIAVIENNLEAPAAGPEPWGARPRPDHPSVPPPVVKQHLRAVVRASDPTD